MSTLDGIESNSGEPTWEIAQLFPAQGAWSEAEYLALEPSRIVEFDNGFVEVHPMPTLRHQLIVQRLFTQLNAANVGTVLFAPLPIRLWAGKYREPDIVILRSSRMLNLESQPDGADLVVEVVSTGAQNRHRDLVVKREEYARAGIPEYWIVDPEAKSVSVFVLDGEAYDHRATYTVGQKVASVEFESLRIEVNLIFPE